MYCIENYLTVLHSQTALTKAGKLTKLLSVFILAVIFGSAPIPPNAFGQIVHEETQTGSSSGSVTVATSVNLTGVNGHLYLATISSRPKRSVQSMQGLDLNWTLVKSKCAGGNTTSIEVWMAQGTPTGNEVVTATFSSVPTTAVIAVSRYSGAASVNPIGNVIAGNTNGLLTAGSCSGGVASNAYGFNITTIAANALVYGAVAIKGRTHTPGAGYKERGEVRQVGGPSGSATSAVAVEDKTIASASTVLVNGSFGGAVDWAMVGVEIKPQPILQYTLSVNTIGSGNVTLNPSGGTYNDGQVVTLTATPAAGFQFSGWSGHLSGSTNPATITMNGNKTVTAIFTESAPNGGLIVHEETQIGASTNSTTVITSANLTGMSGQLYLAAISSRPKISVQSVSGLNLTWTLVKSKCAGRNTTGIEVWMAQATPGEGTPVGSDAVTATFASPTDAAVIAVSRYSGVATTNPVGNSIAGNTNGLLGNGVCSGGADNTSYSFDAATTVNGAVFYSAVALKARTHTPGAGYVERAETQQIKGAFTSSLAVQDKSIQTAGNVTVNGSFNDIVDWAFVGLEIKPPQYTLTMNQTGSGSVSLNPAGGVYTKDTVVTLTATAHADSGYEFSGWSGDLSGSTNPATITMNDNKSVTATFTPIQYTLTVNTIGSGSVTLNPAGGIYNWGTMVTLTATANSGFQFDNWSGDLSGSANPAMITINGNKSIAAVFGSTAPNNQILHQETQTGASSGSMVTTAASLFGVKNHLYLAAISTRPRVQVTAVSGLGLSWTLVKSQCSGRGLTGVELWMAQGTPTSNSAIAATLASAPDNAVIAVSRYSGANTAAPLGSVISGNTHGLDGVCSLGTDAISYSFDLATSTNGTMVYGAVALRSGDYTPGTGYTERADLVQGSGGNSAALAVQDKSVASASTVAVNGSFHDNRDYAVVAVEIQPSLTLTVNLLGAGSVALNPPGGVYNSGTVVQLTAAPAAGFQFNGWAGNLSGSTNPRNITMNGSKTVLAKFTPISSGDQIVLEEIQTGVSTNAATVTTSANLIGVQDHLYLAVIATKARVHLDGVSGLGLNWTLVDYQCSGRGSTMVEIWMAQGTPTMNEPVTATMPAATTSGVMTVLRYSGVNTASPLGNMVSGNTHGEEGVCTLATDSDAYSFYLTTTVNDAVIFSAAALRSKTHTAGAGYTERVEISQGAPNEAAALAVMDKTIASPSTIQVNGTLNDDTDWAMSAVEINPKASMSKREAFLENATTLPSAFQLEPNYPNPFNPSTVINFSLPVPSQVKLRVYDVNGHVVRTLVAGAMKPGRHSIRWNGRNEFNRIVAAGMYIYKINAEDESGRHLFTQTRRMIFLK
jgi:uncharacterized repeat protein (TIGR02543 family)